MSYAFISKIAARPNLIEQIELTSTTGLVSVTAPPRQNRRVISSYNMRFLQTNCPVNDKTLLPG